MSELALDDLRMVVAVAESPSLTVAAARLAVSLNAVSRRLARLEEATGVRLVQRTTRSLALTEAGDRLYRRALSVLEEVDLAWAELSDQREEAVGTVRLVLPSSSVTGALLGRLRALLALHARLRVQLVVTSQHLPLGNDVDLALIVGDLPDRAGLVARRIAVVHWGLCASPSYAAARGLPQSPGDLARHECLRYRLSGPQDTWALEGPDGAQVIVPVTGSFESDDSRILGDAAYQGLGIGIRPQGELAAAVERGLLVEVLPGWRFQALPLYLVSPRGRGRLPGVRTVAEAVTIAVAELA
jgi:DNA-binding transcriptional LysR family regulator